MTSVWRALMDLSKSCICICALQISGFAGLPALHLSNPAVCICRQVISTLVLEQRWISLPVPTLSHTPTDLDSALPKEASFSTLIWPAFLLMQVALPLTPSCPAFSTLLTLTTVTGSSLFAVLLRLNSSVKVSPILTDKKKVESSALS